MPLITDPLFYAVAVPAVLLVGICKSGFGAGFGALGVPLMALAVPVPQAVAMLPLLLLPVAPLGVWLGVRVVRHIAQALLYRLFSVGLLLTGSKLLWDGLR